MKKIYWSVGIVGVGLLAAGAWWWTQGSAASDAQYRFGKLEVGKLQATVAASGAVNPVSQVSVGTQVSGQIRDLLVDFNSEVKAGQLLAQIDPETFEYRVRSSQADVDAAQAAVMTAQANVTAAQAQVSRAQVDLDEARRDFERKQMLVEKQFIAQSEADKARALVNTSMESLKAVQAQVGVAQAQVKTAQANVAQRQASLAQARIDLARTKITSPVNGMVIKRAIERGQTVASSLQAPELFVIAQNLSDMQVEAAIDESDVGRLRAGQKASFTVDAYPGQTFDGEIRQVRKAAQNVANVVTYVAVVGFSNVGGKLLPGMTANVRIVTDQRNEVLKVPNAALRMRIAGVEPEKETKPDAKADGKSEAKSEAPSDAKAGGGAARGMTEFRNRLVAELKLTAEQTTRVDAIYADLAPKFAALRDVPAEERPKARERVSADLRARIADVLSAEQKTQYSALVAEAANRGSSASTRGRVYTMDAQGKVKALNVRLGISDGSMTEVMPDRNAQTQALKEGDEVIIGNSQGAGGAANKPRAAGPRPPF